MITINRTIIAKEGLLESIIVERLDHLGVVAEVIKQLKIIELIDVRIPKDEQENIRTGQVIAGMILNGLR